MSARNKARVSVIIPAFNNADTISDALQSAIDQNYPNMEIIVIDDGSTDDSSACLEEFASQIKIISQKNSGAAAARNAGLSIATGDYVAFLDADDIWLPDKLSKQIGFLEEHPEFGLACGLWRRWSPHHQGPFSLEEALRSSELCEHSRLELSGWIYHKLLMDCYVWTSTVVMRRSVVEEVGEFDVGLRRGQDYDFWLRASRKTQIIRLPEVLALYRMKTEGSELPGTTVDYESLVIDRAVAQWGLSSPDGRSLSRKTFVDRRVNLRLNFAYTATRKREWRHALRSQFKALLYAPLSPSVWILVGRSLLGTTRHFFSKG